MIKSPYYETEFGSAYLGDSLELLAGIPDESIDLICTSPPFALVRKKEYGNVNADKYVKWFEAFAKHFYRILKSSGSLVIDIGGSWVRGYPVRSLYHFELVVHLCKPRSKGGIGFHLAQELYWYNPAKLPTPAEWVTVRRERVKDAVNTVWWLAKEPHPKAYNKRVLKPYSDAMKNLLKNGYQAKLRPSGHDISTKFKKNRGGAIPPNLIDARHSNNGVLVGSPILGRFDWLVNDLAQPVNVISASNTASNDFYQKTCKQRGLKPHPARFPQALPEFIIKLCTEPGDLVLDPFCGSNTTGRVAEDLKRSWLSLEINEEYLKTSQIRFEPDAPPLVNFQEEPNLELLKPAKEKILSLNFTDLVENKSDTINRKKKLNQLVLPLFEDEEGIDFMSSKGKLKFTYGHQFEPEKFSLFEIIELAINCEPNRKKLQQKIANRYFSQHSQQSSNPKDAQANRQKLAMNCFLSLRAYQLVRKTDDDWQYQVTDLAKEILVQNEEQANRIFARHILTELAGMSLLRAIEAINSRGETPKLELIGYELQEMGYSISPNAIYSSTMRKWLDKANVFERQYEINWDVVSDILAINKDYVDELYGLTPEQKYFLLSMIQLDIKNLTSWNKITKHAKSVYKVRFTTKNFVKEIIEPLVNFGLIKTEKTTSGRGAKPVEVKLTDKANNQLVAHLIATIADLTQISETELSKSLEDVLDELDHPDKHIKGKALELLAIWMIRLTSLRFTKWRKRDYETGKGEVDVLAASDRFVYSRWQIQCKNTKRVDVDVLAKEVGMTFVTGADVVMVVTTGKFTRDAFQYAYRMMEVSRYYMILLQQEDIELIKQDKTNIVDILDQKARRVFAKKELGMSDEEVDQVEGEEAELADADVSLLEEE